MAAIQEVTAEIWDSGSLINVIIRVLDSDGREGVGETWWGIADQEQPQRAGRPMASVINDLLAPRLIGRDADLIEEHWSELADWGQRYGDQGLYLMGLSGVDIALWDLKAKRADQSVCELLGGPVVESLPAYASLPWFRSAELVMSETRRAVDAGFRAVKLHEVDLSFTENLRREYGDDLGIMIDVNGAFTVAEAIEHGRRLGELGVLWFEEPVHPMRDHDSISAVAAAIECPVAAGENESRCQISKDWCRRAPWLTCSPRSQSSAVSPLPADFEVGRRSQCRVKPAQFPLGPSCQASIHWAFSSPATEWLELAFFPEGKTFSHPMALPPLTDGHVMAPAGPGLELS